MKNLILIGFMGSGKSTLGKKLAKKLNYSFIDSDEEIERISGMKVSEIFEKRGEAYFRELEHDFLKNLKSETNFVLSTGGGLPCFHGNMELLNELGLSFFLKLSAFELTKRLTEAKIKRPLVQEKSGDDLYYFIKEKLSERLSFYQKAHFTLNGKQQNVNSILKILSAK